MERWPSGWRRTLGKRVNRKLFRGFESLSLRHKLWHLYGSSHTSSLWQRLFISNRTHRGSNLLVFEKKIAQQNQWLRKNNLTNAFKFNILEKYASVSLTFCQVFFCLSFLLILNILIFIEPLRALLYFLKSGRTEI